MELGRVVEALEIRDSQSGLHIQITWEMGVGEAPLESNSVSLWWDPEATFFKLSLGGSHLARYMAFGDH